MNIVAGLLCAALLGLQLGDKPGILSPLSVNGVLMFVVIQERRLDRGQSQVRVIQYHIIRGIALRRPKVDMDGNKMPTVH